MHRTVPHTVAGQRMQPAYLRRADHFPEVHIHPRIAIYHVPVVCFPIFQLYQLHITAVLSP